MLSAIPSAMLSVVTLSAMLSATVECYLLVKFGAFPVSPTLLPSLSAMLSAILSAMPSATRERYLLVNVGPGIAYSRFI
eukprot:2330827-Rhodomonas_salina.1